MKNLKDIILEGLFDNDNTQKLSNKLTCPYEFLIDNINNYTDKNQFIKDFVNICKNKWKGWSSEMNLPKLLGSVEDINSKFIIGSGKYVLLISLVRGGSKWLITFYKYTPYEKERYSIQLPLRFDKIIKHKLDSTALNHDIISDNTKFLFEIDKKYFELFSNYCTNINEGLFDIDKVSDLTDNLNSYIELELYSESSFFYIPISENFYQYEYNDRIIKLIIDNEKYINVPKRKKLEGNKIHNIKIYCSDIEHINAFTYEMKNLISINFSNYKYRKNTIDFNSVFHLNKNLTKINFGNAFKNTKIINAEHAFEGCFKIKEIDLSNLDFSRCKRMNHMFVYCEELTSIKFGNIDTSNNITVQCMFTNCKSLENLDLSNFDLSNCENMCYMFDRCKKLKSINFGNIDTSNVKLMQSMFENCKSLKILDLSKFDLSNCENSKNMFDGCNKNLKVKSNDPKLDKIIEHNL
jgi:surface protein